MKYLISLIIVVAAVALVACAGQNQEENQVKETKALVLYYSQNGTTKAVAEEIQRLTGADIEAIVVEEPYSGNFQETIERVQKERQNSVLPKLAALKSNLDDYDVIYLGYPIWFGTYAPPMAAFVKNTSLEGKKVVPFCSFGSGGLEVSIRDLQAAQPKAEFAAGYGVRTARIAAMPAEVDRFLKENGYIEGEVEPLPEYSAQQPVTAEETAIFNAACSAYEYPLGTPVTCGKRETATSTDYNFGVKSQAPDGSEIPANIFVTVAKAENATPEFTRVAR